MPADLAGQDAQRLCRKPLHEAAARLPECWPPQCSHTCPAPRHLLADPREHHRMHTARQDASTTRRLDDKTPRRQDAPTRRRQDADGTSLVEREVKRERNAFENLGGAWCIFVNNARERPWPTHCWATQAVHGAAWRVVRGVLRHPVRSFSAKNDPEPD